MGKDARYTGRLIGWVHLYYNPIGGHVYALHFSDGATRMVRTL